MKLLRWAALVLGLAAMAMLIIGNGTHQLGMVLARGGLKLLLIPVVMLVPLIIDAKGWQVLIREPPPWRRFLYARWVGESVNSLLPVAQVGGLFIKSYLLGKRGIEPKLALASAIVADTVSAGSLLVFIAFSLALMAIHGMETEIVLPLALGAGLFCLPVYFFYRLQRSGMAILPSRLHTWASGLTSFTGLNENADVIRNYLEQIYCDKTRLWKSFFLQLIAWLVGSIEVWLIVHLLGGTISVVDALILEGLGQTVRNVAFFIPGALGIQEGAYLLVGSMLGLTPALALSISLVKRFRELAQGLPGLIVWQINEGWSMLRGAWHRKGPAASSEE